jgi:hypothetical protein
MIQACAAEWIAPESVRPAECVPFAAPEFVAAARWDFAREVWSEVVSSPPADVVDWTVGQKRNSQIGQRKR